MKRVAKWAGWFLPLFLMAAVWLPLFPPSLVISAGGKVLAEYSVTDLRFEVRFVHSINKGVVREVYRIDPQSKTFWLERGYFENYGAGMVDTVPPEVAFSSEDHFLVLDFPPAPVREVRYIAGPVAKHRFFYAGNELALYQLAPGISLRFEVRSASLFQRLFGLAPSK